MNRLKLTIVFSLLVVAGEIGSAAESTTDSSSPIAESSDLSSALPPGEWSRVETSVDKGLAWLAANQASDGSFPGVASAQPALTSFAVMAFLSRGHMPDQGRYGKQINQAIDYVLSTQTRRGVFSKLRIVPTGQHLSPSQTAIYNHTISGLMLGEVFGMTGRARSRKIREAIERALVFSRSVQVRKKAIPEEQGGWRYVHPENGNSSDLSVTGWALMFLRSARNAEFDVPKEYFDEGLDFVEACFVTDPALREDGVFHYRADGGKDGNVTRANTGSGMLTLMLGGRQNHESIGVGIDWYRSRPYPSATDRQAKRFYLATYYSSQAMAQVGGDTWNQMYPQIARSLLDAQTDAGAWPQGRVNESAFGATYTTSLAILSLTPAYQLLPIYQR